MDNRANMLQLAKDNSKAGEAIKVRLSMMIKEERDEEGKAVRRNYQNERFTYFKGKLIDYSLCIMVERVGVVRACVLDGEFLAQSNL